MIRSHSPLQSAVNNRVALPGRFLLLAAGILGVAFFSQPTPVNAEDLKAIFSRAQEFVDQKNYAKALEELSWAQKEIEKLKNKGLEGFFPESLGGLKGAKLEVSSALGLTNVAREYEGGGERVRVSLIGVGGNSPFGGMAGIGRMAAMMNQGQGEQFRINGMTASLDKSGARPELSIFLDSGGILKVESEEKATGEKLKEVANAIDIAGLDKYLKGETAPAKG